MALNLSAIIMMAVLVSNTIFGISDLVQYSKDGYVLRSPSTKEEWDAYHKIRITEIHNRYCPELTYDYKDPEENLENNFQFVLLSPNTADVVGVIRIDLLDSREAALRWVAIRKDLQGQGIGRRMLKLAELFVINQGRSLVRVPAEENSRWFYEKQGYAYMQWPGVPKDAGNATLAKEVSKADILHDKTSTRSSRR
jgi:ribosomal protein S18 acetylase RimI-like enzyme